MTEAVPAERLGQLPVREHADPYPERQTGVTIVARVFIAVGSRRLNGAVPTGTGYQPPGYRHRIAEGGLTTERIYLNLPLNWPVNRDQSQSPQTRIEYV